MIFSNEIEKRAVDREKVNSEKMKTTGWEGFKKTTSESAKMIWKGVDDAASSLCKFLVLS